MSEAIVRREGAGEVRFLSVFLLAALVAAYLVWTKKAETVTAEKVNISELAPERVSEVVWMTRTQTVTVSRKDGGFWFDVESGSRKRGFRGNKSVSGLIESLAPFVAVRKLPDMTAEQLKDAKLERPDQKLLLRASSGDKSYEVGGRTYGTRDWYVRPAGGKDVYVVGSKVLQDLEYAEGKYMQRELRTLDKKDVSGALLKAGAKERRYSQQNRLSPSDAFWARAETAETKDENAGNYLRKLEGITAMSYAEPSVLTGATKILELSWLEEDKPKESLSIYRGGEAGKEKYYATADATGGLPVEIAKSLGEQAEQDLPDVLAD